MCPETVRLAADEHVDVEFVGFYGRVLLRNSNRRVRVVGSTTDLCRRCIGGDGHEDVR